MVEIQSLDIFQGLGERISIHIGNYVASIYIGWVGNLVLFLERMNMDSTTMNNDIKYKTWQKLRRVTSTHNVLCDCDKCSNRRKLGGQLKLPYAKEEINEV